MNIKNKDMPLTRHPKFQTVVNELRKFGFISYISVHASLNNLAYNGDTETKQFIKEFKACFHNDLNQATDFLKKWQNEHPRGFLSSSEPLIPHTSDVSQISQTIFSLNFPFFLKTYPFKEKL